MLASTRFNVKTFNERTRYMEEHNLPCIYGTPLQVKSSIPLNTLLFVIEMNNEKNQIEGVGLIRNMLTTHHCIYKDNNYNRYIYKGKYRITREMMEEHDYDMLIILELILFKGKSHIKRHSGITIIPFVKNI